jgi:biopolymer transport protein ExbB/TolQ
MSQPRKNILLAALDGSFVLAAVCTAGFYAIMHSPGMKGTLLHRYTTEHIVEYVVVALSFWGFIDILKKLLGFPRETLALRHPWLPACHGREPAAHAAALLATVNEQPSWLRWSRIGRRYAHALEYVVENGSPIDYRDQLQSLANQDADRTYANYTLVRFVVRVAPVLGFLGTVVHFGTALNGMSFDQSENRLGLIVSEMGQAFNTTTVALASSMFMMFAQFICEWIERGIVQSVDRQVRRDLLNRFEAKDANILPFLGVIKSANDEALAAIAANLQQQTVAWGHAFDGILERFDRRQSQDARAWTDALDVLNSRNEANDIVREERLRQLLDLIEARQDKFMGHIQATLEKAVSIGDNFDRLVESLDAVARGEGRLVELQAALADNLRVIHETQQIDDALHGLTGAIHLLTARHPGGEKSRAA